MMFSLSYSFHAIRYKHGHSMIILTWSFLWTFFAFTSCALIMIKWEQWVGKHNSCNIALLQQLKISQEAAHLKHWIFPLVLYLTKILSKKMSSNQTKKNCTKNLSSKDAEAKLGLVQHLCVSSPSRVEDRSYFCNLIKVGLDRVARSNLILQSRGFVRKGFFYYYN